MMIRIPETDAITYNPVANTFEALVEIQTDTTVTTYPCRVEAGLTTPMATVAFKLSQQAKKRHRAQDDLRAIRALRAQAPLHAQQHTDQHAKPHARAA